MDEVENVLREMTIEEMDQAIENLEHSLAMHPYEYITDLPFVLAIIDWWNQQLFINPEFDIEFFKQNYDEAEVILKLRRGESRYKIYVNWQRGLCCAYIDKGGEWWYPLPGFGEECI